MIGKPCFFPSPRIAYCLCSPDWLTTGHRVWPRVALVFRPGGEEPAAVGFEVARSLFVRQGPAVGLKKAGSGLPKRGPSFRVLVPGGAVCGSFLALGISERGSGLVQVSLWHFPGHCPPLIFLLVLSVSSGTRIPAPVAGDEAEGGEVVAGRNGVIREGAGFRHCSPEPRRHPCNLAFWFQLIYNGVRARNPPVSKNKNLSVLESS